MVSLEMLSFFLFFTDLFKRYLNMAVLAALTTKEILVRYRRLYSSGTNICRIGLFYCRLNE